MIRHNVKVKWQERRVEDPGDREAKRQRAAGAALDVFQRYGFARTTMGDIAEAIGISRPALYLLFQNKEEIFAAAVQSANERNLRDIRVNLATHTGLESQLTYACQAWVGAGYDQVRRFPDAKDLTDLPLPPVQQAYGAFQQLLAELLAGAVSGMDGDVTADALARLLAAAMRGFKGEASDRADLDRLIALEVKAVVSLLACDSRTTDGCPRV